MKRYLEALLMLCIIMSVVISNPVAAMNVYGSALDCDYVYSDTTELSEDELNDIRIRAYDISSTYRVNGKKIGVYFAIVDKYTDYGSNIEDVLDDFSYEILSEECDNRIVMVVSLKEREYDIRAYGEEGIKVFNDYVIDSWLEDSFIDEFKNDNWKKGIDLYLDECEEILKQAERGNIYTLSSSPKFKALSWGISAAIALIIAVVVGMVLKSQMKSVAKKVEARNYVTEGSFNISYRNDCYTHSTETRRKIESSSSSSSGRSGGGSHHSGKF